MTALRSLLRGFTAGLVATLGMSALMFAGRRAGVLGRMPPEKITARALSAAGVERSRTEQDLAAGLLHLGFGGAAGAVFDPLLRGLGLRLSPVLQGALFGSAVWAVSYAGWIPALGIMPPPSRDRPGRPPVMLAAHLVYGGLLGALCGAGQAAPRGSRRRDAAKSPSAAPSTA